MEQFIGFNPQGNSMYFTDNWKTPEGDKVSGIIMKTKSGAQFFYYLNDYAITLLTLKG
jgi:hypothetical protein